MKQFIYKLRVLPPYSDENTFVSEQIQYIEQLTEKGVVLFSGKIPLPVSNNNSYGIVVFNASDEEAAREIMNNDPAIKMKIMSGELYPFSISLQNDTASNKELKKDVTGIGGVFFKSKNPEQLREWYTKHLGIPMENWGTMFQWRGYENPQSTGYTVWSAFPDNTEYFNPSKKEFMINYRVSDLDSLLQKLKDEGVTVLEKKEESEFGKFGWILDAEENKIELWQPPEK